MKHGAVAIIPARGGSKRIPKKNLVKLAGKPLLVYTIEQAKKSKIFSGIFVSTDDEQIAGTAKENEVAVIARPKSLATDKSSTLEVLQHATKYLQEKIHFDTVVTLQPTTPFRTTKSINKGVNKLWDNWNKFDAIISIKESKFPPNWLLKTSGQILEFLLPNEFKKIRGQDLPDTYEIDGVLYVIKTDVLMKVKKYPFIKGRTGFIKTGKIESIDIDDREDLRIARSLISTRL